MRQIISPRRTDLAEHTGAQFAERRRVIPSETRFDAINPGDGHMTIVEDHGLPGAPCAQRRAERIFSDAIPWPFSKDNHRHVAFQLRTGEHG
ncbi:MAG: hypothetical protein ACP5PN_07605 [Steroidobacteraceae bacterium]